MMVPSFPADTLLGLPLEVASARLTAAEQAFVVIEADARPSRAAAPVWGGWRVVRVRHPERYDQGEKVLPEEIPGGAPLGAARNTSATDGVQMLELLVARELLRDERAPRP